MRFLPLLALIGLVGCEDSTGPDSDGIDVLVIESDTGWRGGIFDPDGGARWVEDDGNAVYEISADLVVCWAFQKLTDAGYLHVHLERRSQNSTEKDRRGVTNAPRGIISQCSRDL